MAPSLDDLDDSKADLFDPPESVVSGPRKEQSIKRQGPGSIANSLDADNDQQPQQPDDDLLHNRLQSEGAEKFKFGEVDDEIINDGKGAMSEQQKMDQSIKMLCDEHREPAVFYSNEH